MLLSLLHVILLPSCLFMNEAEGSKFLIGCKADQSEKGLGWAFRPFTKVPHSVFVFRSLSAIEIKKKKRILFSTKSRVFCHRVTCNYSIFFKIYYLHVCHVNVHLFLAIRFVVKLNVHINLINVKSLCKWLHSHYNAKMDNCTLIGQDRHNRMFCLWCHFEILPRQITKKRVAHVFRITYYRFMKCPFPIPLSILTYGQIKHNMNSQVNFQCKPLRHLNTFHSGKINKNLFLTIFMGFDISFRITWRYWTSGGLVKMSAL